MKAIDIRFSGFLKYFFLNYKQKCNFIKFLYNIYWLTVVILKVIKVRLFSVIKALKI